MASAKVLVITNYRCNYFVLVLTSMIHSWHKCRRAEAPHKQRTDALPSLLNSDRILRAVQLMSGQLHLQINWTPSTLHFTIAMSFIPVLSSPLASTSSFPSFAQCHIHASISRTCPTRASATTHGTTLPSAATAATAAAARDDGPLPAPDWWRRCVDSCLCWGWQGGSERLKTWGRGQSGPGFTHFSLLGTGCRSERETRHRRRSGFV